MKLILFSPALLMMLWCVNVTAVLAENGAPQDAGVSLDAHPFSLVKDIDFSGPEMEGFHDCFWIGPVSYLSYNIAFPDEGAVYWGTSFQLPEGASHLEIEGRFPDARYMSYHAYDKLTQPTASLLDTEISASEGVNPFANTDKSGGRYVVRIVTGNAPTQPEENTLYLGLGEQRNDRLPMVLRIYAPAEGADVTGGAGLPQASLVMKDGSRLEGDAMCRAVNSPIPGEKVRELPSVAMEEGVWRSLMAHPQAPQGFPARPEVEWLKFWGGAQSVARNIPGRKFLEQSMRDAAAGDLPKRSGFYANHHNDYISAFISQEFGELLVIEGKLPTTPASGWDVASSEYDLRYWSLCTNESLVTTAYSDCVLDSNVTLDAERNYRIVVSKAANRPANARAECGATWLDWGERGDGAGNPAFGYLILRNMLGEDFTHSVQNVVAIANAADSMGPYYPLSHYSSKTAFEAQGCPVKN